MKAVIYKLKFRAAVHFGSGRLSSGGNVFFADTLFSALCHEAVKLYGSDGAEKLYRLAHEGELMLSDGMPYCGDILLVPKPIIHIEGERESDSSMKKKFKKLKYIPINDMGSFLDGKYDPSDALDIKLGESDIRNAAAIHDDDDNEPFNIGTYTFAKNCGLYFIAQISSDEAGEVLDKLLESLSYTGIGGKVSAGLGRFEFTKTDMPAELEKRLAGNSSAYMSLSVSMAMDDELDSAVQGAYYEMIKRSGFVASPTYADNPQKKTDLYCFRSGSCFKNRFHGGVFDVSAGGNHPVYRYAKPMFMSIGREE